VLIPALFLQSRLTVTSAPGRANHLPAVISALNQRTALRTEPGLLPPVIALDRIWYRIENRRAPAPQVIDRYAVHFRSHAISILRYH
jgi:hypothetical protein